MAKRDIAAEVLEGLREIQEFQAGKRTLLTTWVPRPSLEPAAEDNPSVRPSGPAGRPDS